MESFDFAGGIWGIATKSSYRIIEVLTLLMDFGPEEKIIIQSKLMDCMTFSSMGS